MLPRVLDQIFKSSSKVQMNMYESKKKKKHRRLLSLLSFFISLFIHSLQADPSIAGHSATIGTEKIVESGLIRPEKPLAPVGPIREHRNRHRVVKHA